MINKPAPVIPEIENEVINEKPVSEIDELQNSLPVNGKEISSIIKSTTPPPTRSVPKYRQNPLLVFCVYGSAAFVYVELIALIFALNNAYTPPGLIFLLSSLGYIGYIIFKVSFMILLKGNIKVFNKK